jgi:hypothetical protein
MANNFIKLKDDVNLSFRKLGKYTGVSFVVLTLLASEERGFRQNHIAQLTAFFDCTSDFLINNSNKGVYVYMRNSIGGVDKVLLTWEQYESLQMDIEVSVIPVFQKNTQISVFGQNVAMPSYQVYRELKRDIGELDCTTSKDLLISMVNSLDEEKIKKFIELLKILG